MPRFRNTNNSRSTAIPAIGDPAPTLSHQREGHVRRPMNTSVSHHSYVCTSGTVPQMCRNGASVVVGKLWRRIPEIEKEAWGRKAAQAKEDHKRQSLAKEKRSKIPIRPNTLLTHPIPTTLTHWNVSTSILTQEFVESTPPQPNFDDYKVFSGESSQDYFPGHTVPSNGYDPIKSMLVAHPDTETIHDAHMVSFDTVNKEYTEVFSTMRGPTYNTDVAPIYEEVDREE